jgi:lipoate-protein ligase A
MALFEALHVYAPAELWSAAMHMGIDEALLETAAVPALRFYRWQRPSISFGYFGKFADVADEQQRREIVRRWTGGGIVYHGDDLTYSLVLPAEVAGRFRSSRVIYSQVHSAIQQALCGVREVTLATAAAPKISDACFANAVEADVLLSGKKIAGAAQRRTRSGLLHQGSIQSDQLPADFADRFAAALCPTFNRSLFTTELLRKAELIAEQRYSTAEWLRRR